MYDLRRQNTSWDQERWTSYSTKGRSHTSHLCRSWNGHCPRQVYYRTTNATGFHRYAQLLIRNISPIDSILPLANTLYQGCRSASKDQHYKSEFEALTSEGQMIHRVACSRDGPEGVKRTYVQDLIVQDAKRIWQLVGEKKAWVFISGYAPLFVVCSLSFLRSHTLLRSSNKMPAAVKAAVRDAARDEGGLSEEDATEYVATMEREGRLIEDCWS